jgi:transposase
MNSAIRPAINLPQVYLYLKPIDFRKGFKGLSAIVECELDHNPFSGYLYVFTNRLQNKIKCLFWDETGFVLYYKSLTEEKFKWPKDKKALIHITGQQINWLLDGYDISAMKPHKKLHYEAVF